MPIFDITDISKEAENYYYTELLKLKNSPKNYVIEQLANYEYSEPKLNFLESMKLFTLKFRTIDDAKNYLFINKEGDGKTAILVIHGGGYVLPLSQNNVKGASLYSKYSNNADVLLVDYKVASQAPHMSALLNVFNSYIYLRSKYENVILAGQSAGGNLALGLLEYLKEEGIPYPKCVILASPWCDTTCSLDSYKENNHNDILFGLSDKINNPYEETDKYMKPLEFDMSDYPAIMINVAKTEMLLDDSKLLYEKLDKEKSEIYLYPLMWHDFYTHNDELKECHDCWVRISKFINKNM